MVPRSRPAALGLTDLEQPALDGRKPLIDVIFVRRIDDGFAVTADEGKHFHSFPHGPILRNSRAPPSPTPDGDNHTLTNESGSFHCPSSRWKCLLLSTTTCPSSPRAIAHRSRGRGAGPSKLTPVM